MKKIFYISLLAALIYSCSRKQDNLTGEWQYQEGLDTAVLVLSETGVYTLNHNFVTQIRNVDRDSGTYKHVEGNVYEFMPLARRHNNRQIEVKSSEEFSLKLKGRSLEYQPGRIYEKLDGKSKELANSIYYTMVPQGVYNNAFEKYVFTNDSLTRFRGYSQTEEIADSLWYPDMKTAIRITPEIFTTLRTAPDGKVYTEDFSYSFTDGKLFFGKAKEARVFLKK
jgi:hypothetical protein